MNIKIVEVFIIILCSFQIPGCALHLRRVSVRTSSFHVLGSIPAVDPPLASTELSKKPRGESNLGHPVVWGADGANRSASLGVAASVSEMPKLGSLVSHSPIQVVQVASQPRSVGVLGCMWLKLGKSSLCPPN